MFGDTIYPKKSIWWTHPEDKLKANVIRNSDEQNVVSSVENSPRQNAHYTSVSLDNSLVNANPAIAESLQQLLQKVNLTSHNFYYYSPPVGNKKGRERNFISAI